MSINLTLDCLGDDVVAQIIFQFKLGHVENEQNVSCMSFHESPTR